MPTPRTPPTVSDSEFKAAMAWLDALDVTPTPATVVTQAVDDVADVVDRLRTAEQDLLAAVLRARATGASWNALALALGVSRQAARQRFAPLEKGALATSPVPSAAGAEAPTGPSPAPTPEP